MSPDRLPFNWFDFALLLVLLLGVQRGRKRGMSEELLTLLHWVALVLVCAFLYQPVGETLANSSRVFGLLSGYVVAYLSLALGVAVIFSLIKRAVGGKLTGSNAFGRGEYYLAMPAGMVRFACMLIAALALLNARLYTPQELRARLAYRQDLYGKDFFPGLDTAQQDVFKRSLTGPWIANNLSFLLIKPTPPAATEFKRKEIDLP